MTTLAVVRSLTSLASAINSEHDAALRAAMTAVEHARRAGALLIDAKDQLPHGSWLAWLAEYCPTISVRTAQGYMRLARADAQHVAHLTVRDALALLSVPRDREAGRPLCGDEESVPIAELVSEGGWHEDDEVQMAKLASSIRRFGQLHPLLVRTAPDGRTLLVDGRRRLAALRAIGATTARVRHLGPISDAETTEIQLSAELMFTIDYVVLSRQVATLVKDGQATAESLAAISPYDPQRIAHFTTLASADWMKPIREAIAAREAAGDTDDTATCPHPREDPATDFRCPKCFHEWSGNPKPFEAGGRAMQDARDHRNNVRRLSIVKAGSEYPAFRQRLRKLQQKFGITDDTATIDEALRRCADEEDLP
jgi:hypothetical protein